MRRAINPLILILLAALVSVGPLAAGQDAPGDAEAPQESQESQESLPDEALPPDPSSEDASEPLISVEELRLTLEPLRRAELQEVADAWFDRVQAKVVEISGAQIALRQAVGEERAAIQERIVRLSYEKSALIERARVVVAALDARGGDTEEFDQYLRSIHTLDIDVTDANALWLYIRGWVVSPDGGVRIGLNILKFIITLIVFWIVALITASAIRRAVNRMRKGSVLLRSFLVKLTRMIILIIGLVVAVSMLGVNVTPMIAAIGAAGLVIGLALQGTLSNFASGILILLYRPFDVGDAVEAGGKSGKVDSMSLFTTTIVSFDNQKIIIPNNSIWGNVITNITGRATRRIDLVFGIGYDDDVDRAKAILREIVEQHPLVLKEPKPNIQLNALADSSVNIIVRPWAKTGDYWTVYWDVHAEVKRRFDDEGISFPYPHREVLLRRVKKED